MAECSSSEKSLLENETIRNQVLPYIQEEILLPVVADESSDIEIIEENITKKTLKKKRKNKLKNDLHKMKKLNSSAQDAITDVCGLQVSIKSLLKNDEIRKQIAPFIEEVVIDCSDSDEEENKTSDTSVRKGNDELTDAQILDKAKDIIAKSLLTKLKRKPKSIKQKHTNNHSTAKKKVEDNNKTVTADKIHVLDLTDDKSDDDVVLSERVKNKSLTKKTITHTKKIASPIQPNQNTIVLENNCESLIIDDNLFVIAGAQQSHQNIVTKSDEIPDLPITDSDDWYYLNIARAPKESSIEDDILIIQNSLKSNENSNSTEIVEELILPIISNKIETETAINVANISSKNTETEKPINVAVTQSKVESEKPISNVVRHRKRRRRRRKPWTIYGNRNTKKDIERIQIFNSNLKNTNDKAKTCLSVKNGNQVATLKNKNSVVTRSQAIKESEEQTACFENEIIESNTSLIEGVTFSHELIPIIKKETESMDSSRSEIAPCPDTNDSSNKLESTDGGSLNTNVFKPLLKPYRIKEITPDFYRDEEKVYKTYQKISARRNAMMLNVQSRLPKSGSNYRDKTLFKKRSRFIARCSKCGKKYERAWSLRQHEQSCKTETDEGVKTDLQCPHCPFKTSWRYNYQAHVSTHLVDPTFVRNYESQMQVQCTVCPTKREVNQPGRSKCIKCHSYNEYLCRMCGKDYTTYTNLKLHVLRNIQMGHGRTCHKCGKGGYPSLCSLKKHVRVCGTLDNENEDKIICNKIPYVRLVRHEQESKESHQMNCYCSNCDTYGTTSDRQAKCETCNAGLSYKCELCNHFLPSYSDLQSHVFNAHIMDSEMCPENKVEESENLEGKNDCDETNYISESNAQVDNVNQLSGKEKGASTNYNSPNKQKSENNSTKEEEERLDTFDKFVENLEEKRTDFQRLEADDDDHSDESSDGMNKVLVSKYSEDTSLSDIVNSNVVKNKTFDSRLNDNCIEDRKDVTSSFKQQCKSNGVKRYCLRCDKTKKDLDIIRIGPKKEICEKCRSELLYQCVKCKRKSNNYSTMLYHWKHYCAFLRPKYSSTVKLTTPEKYKNSDMYYRIQRHQCRLCPYSSNLKNRLMLHLQMHSWKDIKSAVLKPESRSNTPVSSE